ncbi:PepSY-associated TM helix domain-containing protein [Pseudorhodoferax sp.]|uniref:PepSY-associated TM helix domain-containing protein n=1 Tax=Pseudorhodoferax sp. TaxID=1993553 RepID=UPI0039E237D0
MKDGFRVRMDLVHTWAGLVLGALLFAIFWTGTLSVFDKEIDRWMMPNTRIDLRGAPGLSVDRDIVPMLRARAPDASAWSILLPSERQPFLTLGYDSEESHIPARDRFHPATLEPLAASNTRGASNFIYPFHHNLTLRGGNNVGALLVGIASMGMLCLLISGIVIHRKIFAEFFTLRLFRSFGRANLDVHNVTGVVLLPFTLAITLSGLVIAHLIYFPQAPEGVFRAPAASSASGPQARRAAPEAPRARAEARGRRAEGGRAEGGERAQNPARRLFLAEGLGRVKPPKVGEPAGMVPIDPMVAAAERTWGPGSVYMVRVTNPGDAGGIVALRQGSDRSVALSIDNQRFSLATGEPLQPFQASPTVNVWNFIGGMHYLQFEHWLLRWLYFLGGLGACAMIATGLLHWTQARNKSKRGPRANVAWMNVLSIAAVTGIVAATGAFLLANRCLDNRVQLAGIASRDLEVYAFYGAWLLCALHAMVRVLRQRRDGYLRAWSEQCWAIAAIAVAAVGVNWLTTGDHLLRTVFTSTYWPVAGADLSLLATAALAGFAARRLARRDRGAERAGAAESGEPALATAGVRHV